MKTPIFKAPNGICTPIGPFQRSAGILCRMCTAIIFVACISSCTKNKDAIPISDVLNGVSNSHTPPSLVTTGIVVSSITGYSDGAGVINALWTGNVSYCASRSNKYNGELVVDCYNYVSPTSTYGSASGNPYYWEINGSGFGTPGTISFSVSGLSAQVVSWTSTKIRIIPYGSIYFVPTTYPPGLNITPGSGGGICYMLPKNVMPLVKSRGYGQCTYEAAYQRVLAGRSVPPTAYYYNGTINSGYIPQQYDVLFWAPSGTMSHTGIITSPITISGSGSSLTYNFTLTEMNATCMEVVTTKSCSFKPSTNTGIYSLGYASLEACNYYR